MRGTSLRAVGGTPFFLAALFGSFGAVGYRYPHFACYAFGRDTLPEVTVCLMLCSGRYDNMTPEAASVVRTISRDRVINHPRVGESGR